MNKKNRNTFRVTIIAGAMLGAPAMQAQRAPPQRIVDAVDMTSCSATADCSVPTTRSTRISVRVPGFEPGDGDRYWYLLGNFDGSFTGGGTTDADLVQPGADGLLIKEGVVITNASGDELNPYKHHYLVQIDRETGEMLYTLELIDAPLFWFVGSLNDVLAEAKLLLTTDGAPGAMRGFPPRELRGPGLGAHDPAARKLGVNVDLAGERLSGVEILAQLRELTPCIFSLDADGYLVIASCSAP